jgi:hypothetical protein
MAIAIVLALVLRELAVSAVVAPFAITPPDACRLALAAGEDHLRETFLAHACSGA